MSQAAQDKSRQPASNVSENTEAVQKEDARSARCTSAELMGPRASTDDLGQSSLLEAQPRKTKAAIFLQCAPKLSAASLP